MSTTITSISIEQAADALRAAGFRANITTQNDRPMIQSAVQGLGFMVTPGNRAPDDASRYVDCSFNCLIQVSAQVEAKHIARWNETKRFARLYSTPQMLVLTMDVFIGAGDAELSLRGYCELWDRVVHEFIAYLRSLSVVTAAGAEKAAAATA
jgi:hypothetical protein